MLRSHRGYDPGAWEASIQVALGLFPDSAEESMLAVDPNDFGVFRQERPHCTWLASKTTRLLVDLNRSSDASDVFSKFTGPLAAAERDELLASWHRPYRDAVEAEVARRIECHRCVVHLSIHTFTPRIAGRWRPIDVGLLFDPARTGEATFCEAWKVACSPISTKLRVAYNQPYLGTDDGLTTHLRGCFGDASYLGIEVEICNRFFKRRRESQMQIVDTLLQTLPANGGNKTISPKGAK
ncbi:N-formylglutamate amidohydrolase [Novipirellula artificiosorum]|uniref:N-formylglutamate amidohydrolase n=2 Tax=Novipirellula artificiosorum TaxID=2528016 RepID=A0A5C6DRD4_9BACT|nr:N-formylglutamate amidohydrolase [Novipirellula artificiosorum]